jgi:hypothetical protein
MIESVGSVCKVVERSNRSSYQLEANMDVTVVYDLMISNGLVEINKGNPERTGRHSFTVARFGVSHWATAMGNIADAILRIIAAAYDKKEWVKNSLSGPSWVSVTSRLDKDSDILVLIIIHCDDDSDAILTKLSHDYLPPIIEL